MTQDNRSQTTKELDFKIARLMLAELKKPVYKRKDVVVDTGTTKLRFLAKDITQKFKDYMPKDEQDLLDYLAKKERN